MDAWNLAIFINLWNGKNIFPPQPCSEGGTTPKCHRYCENSDYATKYDADKTFGQEPHDVMHEQEHIMKELMTNGPTETAFSVYEDFVNYK